MAKKLTKVQINSITVKDDSSGSDPKLLINWNYPQIHLNEISEITLSLKKDVFDTVNVIIGQTVDVWEGFTTSTDKKRFSGFVSNIRLINGIYEIVCKDKMWDLLRGLANNIYLDTGGQAGQVSAIAKDLIETFGGLTASVVATGTSVGQTIAEFRCQNSNIFERLDALRKAVNYQMYYDADADVVRFEPRGNTDNGVTLTTGTEIINVPEWEDDDSLMVNDLILQGAVSATDLRFPTTGTGQIGVTTNFDTTGITLPFTPESVKLTIDSSDPPTTLREGGTIDSTSGNFYFVDKENKTVKPATGTSFAGNDFAFVDYTWLAPSPIHLINQSSIDTYGSYKKELTFKDVRSVADAESRAAQILSRFSIPFTIGKFFVRDDNSVTINVGDSVGIIDTITNPQIDANFVITKIVKRYPGDFQEVTVGDESIRMSDWQFSVEDRLKRLEEENSNQDILMELRDFLYTTTHQPRYRYLFQEVYNVTNARMIWDNADHGVWDTNKWGDGTDTFDAATDHFIMQFENSYTESFLDTDFDSGGNASWSNTGSVTFTSGQVAESTSIDFNNGTITAATLTSTEVSGAFDYEMSTDYVQPIAHYKLNDNLATTNVIDSAGSNDGTSTQNTVDMHNLIAHYKLNDNLATTNVIDSAGSNDGTLTGGNSEDFSTTGKINNSFVFDGDANDHVDCGNDSSLTGDLVSFGGWIKHTDSSRMVPFGKFFTDYDFYLEGDSGGGVLFFGDGTTETSISLAPLDKTNNGEWQHIFCVINKITGNAKVYQNGTLKVNQTSTPRDGTTPTTSFKIGHRGNGNNVWIGNIDDVRIYNKILTQAEITAIYNSGNGTENTVVDGKVNNGLTFNGVDDFVTMPSGVNLSSDNSFSISVWAKIDTFPASGSGQAANIIGFIPSNLRGIGIDTQGSGERIKFIMRDNSEISELTFVSSPTEGFHHLVATYNATTNTMEAFYDEVSQGTTTHSTTLISTVNEMGGNNILSGNPNYFDGKLDDVRIYNKVLSQTEISKIYNSGNGTEENASWETVTSGTAHTFSNTGTDLRWRATENSASTGEISQIKITNYH